MGFSGAIVCSGFDIYGGNMVDKKIFFFLGIIYFISNANADIPPPPIPERACIGKKREGEQCEALTNKGYFHGICRQIGSRLTCMRADENLNDPELKIFSPKPPKNAEVASGDIKESIKADSHEDNRELPKNAEVASGDIKENIKADSHEDNRELAYGCSNLNASPLAILLSLLGLFWWRRSNK